FKHYKEIYIGHTPTTNYGIDVPIQAGKLWNMDTGAAFTGKVSIMDIKSKRYWQSTQVATLYPKEKGRN
ncbi:MAG: serine/threonine protein phosphatase, partial [Bacteroidota bacterium]